METTEKWRTLPLVALKGVLVFPGMIANLDIGREWSLNAVSEAMKADRQIVLVTQKNIETQDPTPDDMYSYGALAQIKQMMKLPGGTIRILVEGMQRVRLMSVRNSAARCHIATFAVLPSVVKKEDKETVEAMRRMVISVFEKWMLLARKMNPDAVINFRHNPDAGMVADLIAGYLDAPLETREELLEAADVKKRLEVLYECINKEVAIAELEKNIAKQVHDSIEKNQKEYYLREQMKAISKELGEDSENGSTAAEYREKIKSAKLPEDVAERLNKEVDRLAQMSPSIAEAEVVRTYLDNVLDLPWGKFEDDNFDIKKAEYVLNRDHYGLKKVKERILEHLAVRELSKSDRGPILCLVGPPGVGKTSLASSVAEAVNRKFTRVSLGGVRDDAEIRGHRRTYIGAMPGRIIHGMQKVGCMNPLFLLDEIDKITGDFRGDPAAALLEALDPEQNHAFSDHYIEFPFDLSHVFWIVTANTVDTIPPALLDRMEVIALTSYTEEEKANIAKLHLIPKQVKENGLEGQNVEITPSAVRHIIRDYTREAGVRNLERKIAAVCRKIAYRLVAKGEKNFKVTSRNLTDLLGHVIFVEGDMKARSETGVVTGLAWTSVGGELLKVEVLVTEGKGNLILTGQMGDVMKESARAGYTYIRSRCRELEIQPDFYDKTDIHIHLPEGAIPKDGPSAGITMATAMVSALTGRKVRADLAMTGEITLSGKILPVGGIKEKMLAAHRYGIRTVLMPERNMQDLEDLPEKVRRDIKFVPVEHMDQVLKLALEEKAPSDAKKAPAKEAKKVSAAVKKAPAKKTARSRAVRGKK